MEELRGVEEKWRLIGRELPGGSVDNITYPDPTDCLREVFKRWLQSGYITTWRRITVALRSTEEHQLADQLKAKYYPGELTTTTSSQYSLESQHGENEMM